MDHVIVIVIAVAVAVAVAVANSIGCYALAQNCDWFRQITALSNLVRVSLLVEWKLKAAKYEIQKPSTCSATLFRCKLWSMFPVF